MMAARLMPMSHDFVLNNCCSLDGIKVFFFNQTEMHDLYFGSNWIHYGSVGR